MKKAILKVIGFLAIVATGLYLAGNIYFSPARIIEQNWGIDLPEGVVSEERKHTDPGFHGDGWRYNVFSFDDPEAEGALHKKEFIHRMTQEDYDIINAVHEQAEVPIEKRPRDLKALRFRKLIQHDNTLLIGWDLREGRYYFYEDIL